MKLNKLGKKISFIFIMLVISLTLFLVNKNINVKAEENEYAKSIIKWVTSNNLPDGNYNVTVKGSTDGGKTEETITYPVELINYYDDVTYSATDGENGIVELGDDTDEYKMLIVKYYKNLTINEGVTLTANTHTTTINSANYELTYKKGMYIHVSGTLTNNGTISMTARGTYNQKGENVYLWKNDDNTFEYVPAVGGAGAAEVSVRGDTKKVGIKGTDGTGRQTGGGGSGTVRGYSSSGTATSGSGSAGTSYSGGTQVGITAPLGTGILSPASLGLGGTASGVKNACAVVGGGGGYYGGSHSQAWGTAANTKPSGGGSGYIGSVLLTNKFMYCYDCNSTIGEDIYTISGNSVNSAAITSNAKKGNGYARITYLGEKQTEFVIA